MRVYDEYGFPSPNLGLSLKSMHEKRRVLKAGQHFRPLICGYL